MKADGSPRASAEVEEWRDQRETSLEVSEAACRMLLDSQEDTKPRICRK